MHSGWNCSWRVNFAEWPLRHPVDSTAIPDRCCFSHTSIVGQGRGTRKTIRNGGRRVMITKAPRGVHLTCIYQHPACSGFISSDRQALVAGWQKWLAWLHSLAGPWPKLRPPPAYIGTCVAFIRTWFGGHSPHYEWMNEPGKQNAR